jgi:hypothetical protein
LDQHNDQEDDEAEHGYDDATLIKVSPILTLDCKDKFVTTETTVAIQECAFCRTKVFNILLDIYVIPLLLLIFFLWFKNLNII